MKTEIHWNGGMALRACSDEHELILDAKSPIGKGTGPTPKDLLLMGLGGCTAMDVLGMLRKQKQIVESLDIEVNVDTSEGVHPAVFIRGSIKVLLKGQIDHGKALEAVQLSQTKYCGVSAMMTKSFPIEYFVELNGELVGSGKAKFE